MSKRLYAQKLPPYEPTYRMRRVEKKYGLGVDWRFLDDGRMTSWYIFGKQIVAIAKIHYHVHNVELHEYGHYIFQDSGLVDKALTRETMDFYLRSSPLWDNNLDSIVISGQAVFVRDRNVHEFFAEFFKLYESNKLSKEDKENFEELLIEVFPKKLCERGNKRERK